jgi:HD-like signal output (HDOD) protein
MTDRELTTENLLERLRKALSEDGDFPSSARVVNQLRLMITNPNATANQLSEIILQEPSLGMRILHLVNSSFYRRAKPITTVSQAVVQIGLRPLAELCSGLVLLQKFVPRARQDSPFANCLKQNIATSLYTATLSAELANDGSIKNELGFLAGSLAGLGILLLGYYFPSLYESAEKRAREKNIDIAQSIKELTGLSQYEISREAITALKLPDFFNQMLDDAEAIANDSVIALKVDSTTDNNPNSENLSRAVFAAQEIGESFSDYSQSGKLEEKIKLIEERTGISATILSKGLENLNELFAEQCSALELKLPVPKVLQKLDLKANNKDSNETNGFEKYINEIEQAVNNQEPTATIITTVMEAISQGLKFKHVLLLLKNSEKTHFVAKMLIGKSDKFDTKNFKRNLNFGVGTVPIDLLAYREGVTIYTGEPIVAHGWPIVAIPVGAKSNVIGVIYAEGSETQVVECTPEQKNNINKIALLLKKSLVGQR